MLIVYGSFMPFRFSAAPGSVRFQVLNIQRFPYQAGARNFSIPDVVSNILLFVPFGVLMVGALRRTRESRLPRMGVLVTGGYGLGFSLAIETGQILAPGRTVSPLDVLCNTVGALGGGLVGYLWLRSVYGRPRTLTQELLRTRPAVVLLGLMILAGVADAFYPYAVTLDVSTAWGNLKHAQWPPLQDGLLGFLRNLATEKILWFAIIGDLMRRSFQYRRASSFTRLHAWCLTVFLVVSIEGGKLFFVGRVPNVEHILVGSWGALLGILLIPFAARMPLVRKHSTVVLISLALLLVTYDELTPFTGMPSRDMGAALSSRIEWLPFSSYYKADPHRVLFDSGKKALLLGSFGFLVAAHRTAALSIGRWWVPPAWGLGVGAVLEALQLLQGSHTPSTTDVLVFGASAWAGASLYERYHAIVGKD
jgi:VanZ family protein